MSTKGCLIFANNATHSNKINYVQLANSNAANIKRHLDLPTTIVTNTPIEFAHNFDKVILGEYKNIQSKRYFEDLSGSIPWLNGGRWEALQFSPYDQTLVLDADYLVASSRLNLLFESSSSFLTFRSSYEVTGQGWDHYGLNFLGAYNMPMNWATIMWFKKDKTSEAIFDVVQMVENNYEHYAHLYSFNPQVYRNDYALSVAISIVNGHSIANTNFYIPWPLPSVIPSHKILKIDEDSYRVEYVKKSKPTYLIVNGMDLHVMGKTWLSDIYEH